MLVRRNVLERVVRVDEGCARALVGEGEGANGIERHRYLGKVSCLVCPGLEREAELAVELRIQVTLPALAIEVFDYSRREERPRLGGEARLLGGAEG